MAGERLGNRPSVELQALRGVLEGVDFRSPSVATIVDVDPAYGGAVAHPPGLYYLSFTEAWERFSFYGMQALLVLYMVGQAAAAGPHRERRGHRRLPAALEGVFGPLSTQALASQIFGLYIGLVYFIPIIGGLLGDRVLGRRAVLLGAVLMAVGHFLMAFEVSLPAWRCCCLIVGSGLPERQYLGPGR